MAACVLCRRVPRLRCLPGLRKDFVQARHVQVKRVDETDDHEGKEAVSLLQESSILEGYRLHYNPTSYHHSAWNSAASWSHTDNEEDEQCLSALPPSFWQQSNRYSVSCSRYLSSSKNTLLDLAFNKSPEKGIPSVSPHHRKPTPTDVKVDPRAFLKCRAAYASTTLDLTQRPCSIKWEEAVLLLKKVAVLKGSMKPANVSQIFTELSGLHPDWVSLVRGDQRFIMLLRYSVENLRLFTEAELLEVLQSLVWLDIPSAHTVLSLYEAELSRRATWMTLHQLLFAADLLRCIGKQVPQFLAHLYDSVLLNLGQIGVPELVQLLYIMGEGRECPKDLIRPLEQLLMRHLPQLYPEEVGTVCLGLFKSQTSLSESAVTCVVDKAHSFVEDMSAFAMVNVLKYMRFSYLYHRQWMEAIAQEVPRQAPKMGVQGLMHVALTCSALHYRNDNILMAIAQRVPSVAPHCRIKDSCKLLWAFGTLQFLPHQSPGFYSSLTDTLRQRKVEFQRYPEHLLTGLLGLIFVSQFPQDLIELALSPEFVNLALKSKQVDLKKDLLTLDGAVALELPHWTGPRLSSELREGVAQKLWKFAQSDVCQKPEVQEAESSLQDLLGGETYVHKRMILPHTRSIDLEIHLDSTGQPIPVNSESHLYTPSPERDPSKFPSDQGWGKKHFTGVTLTDNLLAQLMNTKMTSDPLTPSPTLKPIPLHREEPDESEKLFNTGLQLTSDITEALIKPSSQGLASQDSKSTVKVAIQVPSRNHYCYQSQQLLGLHVMKRRQLKLAGYQVVELGHREWSPMLRKSRAEKLAYLHCKVYDSLTPPRAKRNISKL
ncbi:FAST kinase domain-containing protein 5, mitochondrial isoform X2 [Notolabrus celidotus]|nr:FAST kinase domain-containing protein 5, mitochondrial isoform X2 [Notolabrus celidotus]XP_034549677.1 FAST kinase domain-containing protein 5, mitochondrial isoform X2 [Notolabrus celidotus]